MTYPEAIQYLYRLSLFGMNPGLANTLVLTALAGNPHERLQFIHVAGTNGKGSTCAMLESIYRAAGLRVGLFTSPHLVSFRERIQINRQLIGESDVVRLASDMKGWIEHEWPQSQPVAASFSLRSGGSLAEGDVSVGPVGESDSAGPVDGRRKLKRAATVVTGEGRRRLKLAATGGGGASRPTFFEVLTVMALRYFAEQKCDLVIWETGLGGRLDATNIVNPLASVITNIGFDHQQWLGETLAKIAFEKAGIIKPGVPVITTTGEPEALDVIETAAMNRRSSLTIVRAADVQSGLARTLALPLLGEHQRVNAALAIATVQAVRNRIEASDDQIRQGLETVQWPGRLQVIEMSSGQTILLDGAHNAAGATALRDAMKAHFPMVQPTLVLGVLGDKDQSEICNALAPLADRILVTPVNSERTAAPATLRGLCARANRSAKVATCGSLPEALERTRKDRFVLIAGSLYLVGEAMELLKVSTAGEFDERILNEWTQKK